jgi:hypothetical protein
MPLTLGVMLALCGGGFAREQTSSANAKIASEILNLTDLVAFLKARVKTENSDLLADPDEFGRRFRRELSLLDLDPPRETPLNLQSGDLEIAGILIEEQMRRRRRLRRQVQMAAVDRLMEQEMKVLRSETEKFAPELLPEVAAIFQSIHEERSQPKGKYGRIPPVTSRSLVSQVRRVAEARKTGKGSLLPTYPEVKARPVSHSLSRLASVQEPAAPTARSETPMREGLDVIQKQLHMAVGDPRKRGEEPDMLYGDRAFKVTSPDALEVEVKQVARLLPPARQILRSLEVTRALDQKQPKPSVPKVRPRELPSFSLADSMRRSIEGSPDQAAYAASGRGVLPILPPPRKSRKKAVLPPPMAPVTPAMASVPRDPVAGGLRRVMARVVPMVRKQAQDAGEYPSVLRATLATLGIELPLGFQPLAGEQPDALAARLSVAASEGEVSLNLETAEALLSL